MIHYSVLTVKLLHPRKPLHPGQTKMVGHPRFKQEREQHGGDAGARKNVGTSLNRCRKVMDIDSMGLLD